MASRLLETLSWFILLSVVALRPLVAESYNSAGGLFRTAIETVTDPSPLRTLAFDAVILVAAAAWLLARAIGPARRYRRTGLEWGGVLVLIAAVISCLFAGNKRLAINGAVDWLCYPVLTVALAQLLRQPWHRRLVVAVVVAGGAVQAFRCVEQSLWTFDETWKQYESTKADIWAKQGVELDSPEVTSFEQRMKAREASGTFSHSNVAGSYLALCAFGALAAATVGRWRRASSRDRLIAVGRAAVFGFLAVGVGLTKSLGAAIAGGAGVLLWLLVYALRDRIDRRRQRVMWIGWSCVVVGGLTVVGHGLYHDSLPGWSLTFRWNYWTASAGMIADHPFTGVGRENFGRHYLRYKPITSPEEVANPHNLFVQAAADWGVIGLAGVLVMLVAGSLATTRSAGEGRTGTRGPPGNQRPRSTDARTHSTDVANRRQDGSALGGDDMPPSGTFWAWGVALLAVVTLGRIPLLGNDNASFMYYSTMTTGIIWSAAFACVAAGEGSAVRRADFARNPTAFSTLLACGLFAFLLHEMINFALFVPASATPFFAILAVCVAERAPESTAAPIPRAATKWLPIAAIAVGIACVTWFGLIPVARANRWMQLAERSAGTLDPGTLSDQRTNRFYTMAAEADPLDPTPRVRRTEWLFSASAVPRFRTEAIHSAIASAEQAAGCDPYSLSPRRMLMELHRMAAATANDPTEYHAAIEAARAVLKLYPKSPSAVAALADRQLEAGQALRSIAILTDAVTNYRRALELDDDRLSWEELHRFNARRRGEIESKIEHASRLIERHAVKP